MTDKKQNQSEQQAPCTESVRKSIVTNESTPSETPPSNFSSSTGEQVNTTSNSSGGQGSSESES
jgi:hypothetical protein